MTVHKTYRDNRVITAKLYTDGKIEVRHDKIRSPHILEKLIRDVFTDYIKLKEIKYQSYASHPQFDFRIGSARDSASFECKLDCDTYKDSTGDIVRDIARAFLYKDVTNGNGGGWWSSNWKENESPYQPPRCKPIPKWSEAYTIINDYRVASDKTLRAVNTYNDVAGKKVDELVQVAISQDAEYILSSAEVDRYDKRIQELKDELESLRESRNTISDSRDILFVNIRTTVAREVRSKWSKRVNVLKAYSRHFGIDFN